MGGLLAKEENEIEIDVLSHRFVPEHIILGEKEIKELMDKYNIIPEQLPKLLKNDPAVKAINAKEGDVVKLIRKSITAGVTTYYRFVVKK